LTRPTLITQEWLCALIWTKIIRGTDPDAREEFDVRLPEPLLDEIDITIVNVKTDSSVKFFGEIEDDETHD
jgi:hypothetical protein